MEDFIGNLAVVTIEDVAILGASGVDGVSFLLI